jgi:hypothetical protein
MMQIILEPENEYITRLTGTYGFVNDIQIITALTFVSNKAVYGPFGTEVGSSFSSSGLGKLVGFFGRSGSFIDRLGIYRASDEKDVFVRCHGSVGSMISGREVVAHGPWGGDGGSSFYDGRGDIVEILVEYVEDYIISLQVTYEQGGSIFKSTARFGPGGDTCKVFFFGIMSVLCPMLVLVFSLCKCYYLKSVFLQFSVLF